jgi:hypothetical protein
VWCPLENTSITSLSLVESELTWRGVDSLSFASIWVGGKDLLTVDEGSEGELAFFFRSRRENMFGVLGLDMGVVNASEGAPQGSWDPFAMSHRLAAAVR